MVKLLTNYRFIAKNIFYYNLIMVCSKKENQIKGNTLNNENLNKYVNKLVKILVIDNCLNKYNLEGIVTKLISKNNIVEKITLKSHVNILENKDPLYFNMIPPNIYRYLFINPYFIVNINNHPIYELKIPENIILKIQSFLI